MLSDTLFIPTERLILRLPTVNDAEDIAKNRSTDFVMRYNLYAACDAEQIISELENYEHILLTEAESGKIIGCVSLRDDPIRYHAGSITLHAWLIEEKAYNGYMAEALRAIIPYLFTKYDMLSVEIFSENTASIRLAKKLGFEQYGFIRKVILTPGGKIVDLILMSM
jgi:RimJ/RimL family protein N-acetyltransferase